MKRSQRDTSSFLSVLFSMVLALMLAACGGGGGSSAPTPTPTPTPTAKTTTISGKVTLSSTLSSSPAMNKAMLSAPKGKPGSKLYMASKGKASKSTVLSSAVLAPALNAVAFSSGTVWLYDSDHPEWLYPVASSPTGTDGSYSMTKLENAAANNNAYKDADPIPAGNYTLLAFKAGGFDPILGTTTTALVAVQTVVSKFEGTVSIPDMVAQESTQLPTVSAMFGAKQNTDGTQTWGSSATSLPANAAIQVNFSAAMSRGSLTNGITISPTVSGKWSLSADWTTATFYPDTGVSLTAGQVYTITVKGSNTDATNAVKNVYGNALAKTATGTFTAIAVDTVAPTAEWESPSLIEMATPVDVTKPIRIRSNKQLDVNGLTLVGNVAGVSSLGAKPGVLYVGKNTSGYYVYEFVLGNPLQLGTTYDLTVSGGKGLNGVAMNSLSGSLITTSAAQTTGVDTTATAATQNAQAAVKDVLGKWIRAFNDRNITQMQSLMSGDFYFEDAKADPKSDVNKDGRLSLAEFSDMLTMFAFPNWEYCATAITGDVVGTINVVGDVADFEFKMVASTSNTSKQCADSLPTDSLYATVKNLNGAWTIVRASSGIDTRSKTISFPDLINTLKLTQDQAGVATEIADGGQAMLSFYDPATTTDTNPMTWSWGATTGVSSYVLVRIDARDPQNGRACALPTTKLQFSNAGGAGCVANGGVNIDGKFGFNTDPMRPPLNVEGGQYYWEVIGLATTTTATIASKTSQELLKDISAISDLRSYSIAGVYKEITVQVYGGATAGTTPVTYSTNYDGYDIGTAGQATITVTTANTAATFGSLDVYGNFQKSYLLNFTGGVATVTIDLSKGMNWINIWDGVGLNKQFSISTTGGLAPVVDITSVTDDKGNGLTLDAWGYAKATSGATKVTITGTVDTAKLPGTTMVDVNVNNDASGAYSHVSVDASSGAFTATLDIYKGDNWINAGAGYQDTATSSWVWYGDHAGIYTDTGTAWVPSISITGVTTATSTGSFGNSSDWDASADTDNVVTITGKFKKVADGTYSINSDGGWSSDTLKVLADGSFSLNVTLYNGWNYVSFNDANYNWYGVNVYTSNGKVVVKPTITTVNDVVPTVTIAGGASAATTGCTATVTGTAKAGNLNVYWNGFDGTNYNYESQTLVLTGAADTPVAFSFSVPLVGGPNSYNNIDVYDLNWVWTGVKVTTSGSCAYVAPAMTVTSVLDSAGAAITPDLYGDYLAGGNQTVTVTGTSNRAGRTITASMYSCSSQNYTAITDASGNWSISGIKVYDGWNSLSVTEGSNWQYLSLQTTNLQAATPALTATVSPGTVTYAGTCGYNSWDAGAAQSVTISGTTTAPDGTGNYTDALGSNHTFTITGHAYSIPNIMLYDGYNNISINDTAWNYQSVSINTINGLQKPQFVFITSPSNTAAVTGVQTVTGNITDQVPATGYKATTVQATVGVYDSATFTWNYFDYSSDTYQQTNYGYLPLTYDAATGSYSFSLDFGPGPNGNNSYINVYAYDDVNYMSHSVTMYYNDPYGYNSTYYYKPGSKTTGAGATKNQAVTSELMKQRLKSINRNR